jgi:hypothetical protein
MDRGIFLTTPRLDTGGGATASIVVSYGTRRAFVA